MQKCHLVMNFWIHCFLTDANVNMHSTTLVRHHKHAQYRNNKEVLQGIKDSLADIRQRTLTSIQENIVSQFPERSFYYAWSTLDLGIRRD